MRRLAFLLALASSCAWAGLPGVDHADNLETLTQTNPALAASGGNDRWLVLQLPVVDGTRSPCCWQGSWNSPSDHGCRLVEQRNNYGTRLGSATVQQVRVFAELRDGQVHSLLAAGPDCPVDAAGQALAWLEQADETATVSWLEELARNAGEDLASQALYTLSMASEPSTTGRLQAMARLPGDEPAHQAIFWLGEARGTDGYHALAALLEELPDGDTRQQINFALSQNGSEAALTRLEQVARQDRDREQRSNALFWLAQENADRAEPLLRELLDNPPAGLDVEQALFAVSQLDGGRGDAMLFEIARDPGRPDAMRRQAFFWLANSDSQETREQLTRLLTARQD
jgi:hypothetical protein